MAIDNPLSNINIILMNHLDVVVGVVSIRVVGMGIKGNGRESVEVGEGGEKGNKGGDIGAADLDLALHLVLHHLHRKVVKLTLIRIK